MILTQSSKTDRKFQRMWSTGAARVHPRPVARPAGSHAQGGVPDGAAARGGVMAPLEVYNPGLHDLIAPDAPIERIAGGLGFTEGPVWRGTSLLFSDIPNKRIVRWRRLPEGPELTTYATGMSNGLTLDRQGQVLAAEHNGRRVTRVAADGTRTVLAERFQGKR